MHSFPSGEIFVDTEKEEEEAAESMAAALYVPLYDLIPDYVCTGMEDEKEAERNEWSGRDFPEVLDEISSSAIFFESVLAEDMCSYNYRGAIYGSLGECSENIIHRNSEDFYCEILRSIDNGWIKKRFLQHLL